MKKQIKSQIKNMLPNLALLGQGNDPIIKK
jgi:hypothetical protein